MWRQRLRWFKGGHLFVLSTDSIFFHRQKHVTLFQKLAYCLGPIAHFTNFWAEPIMCALARLLQCQAICLKRSKPVLTLHPLCHLEIHLDY